jgi:hypothetical protein
MDIAVFKKLGDGARAQMLVAQVADVEDRDIVEGDLKSGPWFGVE